MNIRLLITLLTSLLIANSVAAGSTPSVTISPGKYIRSGDSGTLTVSSESSGELKFEIESIGSNCHVCSVSGAIRGKVGYANDGDTKCRIAFERNASGLEVSPTTPEECRYYCGMRASFDGSYKIPLANCTRKSQQTRRDEFIKLYRAHSYKKAGDGLLALLSQCSEFMNWIEKDSVRNDLALAQFHNGDAAACLKTLETTQAAKYPNKENLKEHFPPCDFDNYEGVAQSTFYNKALCEKAGAGKR